jgi:hypothetical protein
MKMEVRMDYELVKVGGATLKVHAHEVTIRQAGDWRLVECTAYSKDGWKSLKLYLDRPAKKNVWRLGVKGEYMAGTSDSVLLVEFYPEMREWVVAQANGREVCLPADDGAAPRAIYIPPKVREFVVESILERKLSGMLPLSHKSQTKKLGRYIVDMIAEEFKVSAPKAKSYVTALIDCGVIEFAMIDTHKRISGLRLVKKEASNG